jgi:hypothetical protein
VRTRHEEADVRFRYRRQESAADPLPAVRRATARLEERLRDIDQRLDEFSTGLAGTADRIREMAVDAERQVEAHDERDA